MRTRTLRAPTLPKAMQLVREVCGKDAIIVATRYEDGHCLIDVAVEDALTPRRLAAQALHQGSTTDPHGTHGTHGTQRFDTQAITGNGEHIRGSVTHVGAPTYNSSRAAPALSLHGTRDHGQGQPSVGHLGTTTLHSTSGAFGSSATSSVFSEANSHARSPQRALSTPSLDQNTPGRGGSGVESQRLNLSRLVDRLAHRTTLERHDDHSKNVFQHTNARTNTPSSGLHVNETSRQPHGMGSSETADAISPRTMTHTPHADGHHEGRLSQASHHPLHATAAVPEARHAARRLQFPRMIKRGESPQHSHAMQSSSSDRLVDQEPFAAAMAEASASVEAGKRPLLWRAAASNTTPSSRTTNAETGSRPRVAAPPRQRSKAAESLAIRSPVLEAIEHMLGRHRLPHDVTLKVLESVERQIAAQKNYQKAGTNGITATKDASHAPVDMIPLLARAFEGILSFAPLWTAPASEPQSFQHQPHQTNDLASEKLALDQHATPIVVLVGLPGCGKTTSCVKLASRALLAGKTVTIINADCVRAGAQSQLSQYTDRLGINLCQAVDGTSVQRAIRASSDSDLIIVDTPAVNPFEAEELARLLDICSLSDLTVSLVMDAGCNTEDAVDLVHAFEPIRARHLVLTKLDISRRLGCIFAHTGMAMSEVSFSPRIGDGLHSIDPTILARLLFVNAPNSNTLDVLTAHAVEAA